MQGGVDGEIKYKHRVGRSFRILQREGYGSKSKLHDQVRKTNPVEQRFSLLRALYEDYLSERAKVKLNPVQRAEIEAFLVFNQQRLYGRETYLSVRQENDVAQRECSPIDDWGFTDSFAVYEPSDESTVLPLPLFMMFVDAICQILD